MTHLRTMLLATTILLSGCAVGPNYVQPALNAPARWLGLSGSTLAENEAPVGDLTWWRAYNDATLNQLITLGVENNGDLRVAVARVKQARANRLAANASLLPDFSGTASAGYNRTAGVSTNTSSAGLGASWELDIFGGGRRAAEAARANVGAADAAFRASRISLLSEVAANYLDVRQLQQQLELTRRNLDIQTETLRIVQAQHREGVVSGLDIARAEAQVATTRAQIPQAEQNLTAATNNLGVLVGLQPEAIATMLSPAARVPVSTPTVLVAQPATVLANRPDVRNAERLLAAATANQGVAISNWFPRVSLTGLFGVTEFGSNGDSTLQGGGTISLPIIDFGRVRALVQSADAEEEAALATYEQTVLAALADVETSLRGYVNAQTRLTDLTRADEASREATRLAQLRYREGVVSLLDVLSAQQQQLSAESALASGQAAVGQTLANLYAALGGGATAPAQTAQQ